MSVSQSFEYLKKLRDFFYCMLELKDKSGGRGFIWPRPYPVDSLAISTVKVVFLAMLKDGVIINVTNVE